MTAEEVDALRAEAATLLAERDAWGRYKFVQYFPDCTRACDRSSPDLAKHAGYCRVLYPKHVSVFATGGRHTPLAGRCPADCDGKGHRERLFLKANRVGGTEVGAFEMTAHLTGRYPAWWPGHKFTTPTECWAAGNTGKTTRDILQDKLLGPVGTKGMGMIPQHLLIGTTAKAGVPDAVEHIYVRHVTGGRSVLQLKSFDQKREAYEGTAKHFIWLDEECDLAIYTECLLRTAATSDFAGGLVLLTFTPLQGLTELVLTFLPGGVVREEGAA